MRFVFFFVSFRCFSPCFLFVFFFFPFLFVSFRFFFPFLTLQVPEIVSLILNMIRDDEFLILKNICFSNIRKSVSYTRNSFSNVIKSFSNIRK